jgi:DNA uptake protein ComE-like DNA-binding protein
MARTTQPLAIQRSSSGILTFMKKLWSLALVAICAGCTSQSSSPDAVRERAANATATIKRDATAVAQGVREGWSREKPLDINSASKEQLLTLPEMTASSADAIIAGRPYNNSSELLGKHILGKSQYEKIADRITTKPPSRH